MKKFYLFLLITLNGFSQTEEERRMIVKDYNISEIENLKSIFTKNFEAKSKKVSEYLKANPTVQKYIKQGSGKMVLDSITPDNKPIYVADFNNGATLSSRARKLWNNGGLGLNIQGQNMFAGVWEVGTALLTHDHYQGRAIQKDGSTANLSDHANHVAGTIMQNKTSLPTSKGMAFEASAWMYDSSNDLNEMLDFAQQGGLISNHSYGIYFINQTTGAQVFPTSQAGKYNASARDLDKVLFQTPYYISVFASGNEQDKSGAITNKGGYDMLNSDAVSKNNIVVGAVNAVPIYTGPSDVVMSTFSCWGPTDDGRIKPDLVMKGVDVNSCFSGSNSATGIISGTSMAAPGVAGTLLLIQQLYKSLNPTYMWSSTLKGLALLTADEAGTEPGPDYKFGHGLINAEAAAKVILGKNTNSIIWESVLNQSETKTFNITALNSSTPIKACISWTDPAGTSNTAAIDDPTPALVNDLDIKIVKNTTTFYPWKLNVASPSSAATNGVNNVDPFEKIEINNPSGEYTVTISHKGTLTNAKQNYALIISGIDATLNSNTFEKEYVALYPNPTNDIINISTNLKYDSIKVIDLVGKSYDVNITNNTINLTNLQKGVYLLQINNDNKIITKKIIKN